MKLNNLLQQLNLRSDAKKELESVLALPEVRSILSREEEREIEHRRELLREKAELPKRMKRRKDEAGATCNEAARHLEKCEEATRKAKETLMLAQSAVQAVDSMEAQAISRIERELWEGRDSRLLDVSIAYQDCRNKIRASFSCWPDVSRNFFTGGRETRLDSNIREVNAALEALDSALADCVEMSYAAVSRDEVAARVNGHAKKLTLPLREFRLEPPVINDKGEVETPAPVRLAVMLESVSRSNDLAA